MQALTRRERRAAEHAKKKIGDYVADEHKIDRVKELARAIGADEDGAAFRDGAGIEDGRKIWCGLRDRCRRMSRKSPNGSASFPPIPLVYRMSAILRFALVMLLLAIGLPVFNIFVGSAGVYVVAYFAVALVILWQIRCPSCRTSVLTGWRWWE